MNRLTSNKNVNDMGMVELAHNSCYVRDGKARYRDYDSDIDAREMAIQLLGRYADIPNEFTCDDDFDEAIIDYMSYGVENPEGLIALLYRNLWAMADLREQLKKYEDLEEQGKLLRLPCAVGDAVYANSGVFGLLEYEVDSIRIDRTIKLRCCSYSKSIGDCPSECLDEIYPNLSDFGKTVFLAQKQAETALQTLKETEGDDGKNNG